MKFLSIILMSLFAMSAYADDKIVAQCGSVQVIYRGSIGAWFAGIKVSTAVFVFQDPASSLISANLMTNSEGGTLTGNDEIYGTDGKVSSVKTYVYDENFSDATLTISEKGKLLKKVSCSKKP